MKETLSERIERCCVSFAGRVAAYEATGAEVGFEPLFLTLLAFAERLHDAGVRPGDQVAVDVNDAIAGTLLQLAVMRLGGVVLPGNRAAIEAVHGLRPEWGLHTAARPEFGQTDLVVDAGWIASPGRTIPISGRGIWVRTTSGTTGTPKLRAYDEARMLARLDHALRHRNVPPGPVFVGYPPGSSPQMNMFLRSLAAGQPQLFQLDSLPMTLRAMDRVGATVAYMSPFNFTRFLDAAVDAGLRPHSLSRIIIGGGAVAPGTAARAESHFDCEVFINYGCAETGSIASGRIADFGGTPGVVGYVYDDFEVAFAGPDGAPVSPGEAGELRLRMHPLLRAMTYPGREEVSDADGWVRTGDIGRLLPDGLLCLTGRVSELINVGGTKRAPAFFEEIARRFPEVRAVAAFRAPVETGLDHVGFVVEPESGFDLGAFARFMTRELGPIFPFHVAVVDAIPSSGVGKVDRRSLTAAFEADRARSGSQPRTP